MSEPEIMSAALLRRLIDESGIAIGPSARGWVDVIMAERLFRSGRPTRYISFLFMAGMFAAFWNTLDVREMAIAFALNFSGTLWFNHLRRDFAARPTPFAQTDRWTNRFALASAITGASWGLLGWFSYVPNAFEAQLTLGFAFCGLITLSVLTRNAHLPSYYAFLILALAPPMLRTVMESSATSLTIAFCGAVFIVFTSIWTHNAHAREERAAVLRLQNAELLQEVDKARAMAEAARDVAENNYRRTLDSLQNAQRIGNIGNWDWDPVSKGLFWSNQFYRLLGYAPGAVTPSINGFLALVDAEDRDRVAHSFTDTEAAETQATIELRITPADGAQMRILFAVIETIRDDAGTVVRMAGTLRDITQQRNYENALIAARAEAERASMAKSNFLGNLSHELRTPLNAVIGFAEMLSLPQIGKDKVPEYGNLILKSSRHLLVLINDLLDIAQIEAGRLELDLEKLQIAELIHEATAQVQSALQKAGCGFTVLDPAGSLVADRQRMLQILATLLEQAIRLSPPDSSLTLTTASDDAMLRITLTSDATLPDIATQAALLHSFEQRAAYQAGELELRQALMHDLVRRHHGDLRNESLPDGSTSLHLRLPIAGPG